MTVLCVGSVALDSVETPFGKADNVLGGSGNFFSASASHLAPVQLVGVIGSDYPIDDLKAKFAKRPIDLAGVERAEGSSFRWRGCYRHDLNVAETLETHLGVFSNFLPKILGGLMLIAGLGWLTFLSRPLAASLSPYHYVAGGIGEGLLTLWLITMGVDETRWNEQASAGSTLPRAFDPQNDFKRDAMKGAGV